MRSIVLGAALLLAAVACGGADGESRAAIDLGLNLDEVAGAPFHFRGIDGWLVPRADGQVDAFWARSPHRGCYVMLHQAGSDVYARLPEFHLDLPGVFRDVCFGSTFLLTGERVFGPSWRGLDRFEVVSVERTPEGDRVTVDFSKVTLGVCGGAADLPCSPVGEARIVEGPELADWP